MSDDQIPSNDTAVRRLQEKLLATAERPRKEFLRQFPGAIAGLSDYLRPVHVRLNKPYRAIRVEAAAPRKEILNFSRIDFFGKDSKTPKKAVFNVGSTATCTQSSVSKQLFDPYLGVKGLIYACNIHTGLEKNPWWQAEFPKNIQLKYLYFFNRMDKTGNRNDYLKITGQDEDGNWETLYHPAEKGYFGPHVSRRIKRACTAIGDLQASLPAGLKASFSEALDDFSQKLAQYTQLDKPSLDDRIALAEPLLRALLSSIHEPKDIGCSPDTAQTVTFEPAKARYVRFRSLNTNLSGLGGLELRLPRKLLFKKRHLKGEQLQFRYVRNPHSMPAAMGYTLRKPVKSRRHDLGKTEVINAIKFWTEDAQASGNAVFTDIAISEDTKNWTTVYDGWQLYRNVLDSLVLPSMILKLDWPAEVPELLGKIYTLYRHQDIFRPLMKLTRPKPTWGKALGTGSDACEAMVRHAPPMKLTKHGLNVPLRHRDTERVMKRFLETRDAIIAAGYEPMLLYGTLLGAIREKDFIPHDDDLDIAIIVGNTGQNEINDAKIRIAEELAAVGLPCRAGGTNAPIVHYRSADVNIDIFILGHKDDTIYWPHKGLAIRPEQANIFLPSTTITFKGHQFAAPNDPVAVTEARYGTGWKTPDQLFEL